MFFGILSAKHANVRNFCNIFVNKAIEPKCNWANKWIESKIVTPFTLFAFTECFVSFFMSTNVLFFWWSFRVRLLKCLILFAVSCDWKGLHCRHFCFLRQNFYCPKNILCFLKIVLNCCSPFYCSFLALLKKFSFPLIRINYNLDVNCSVCFFTAFCLWLLVLTILV